MKLQEANSMSHYVYVIVNKINLKLYFGSHSWSGEGLDPNYYGSGKIIKQAVNKYGRDNFIIQPIKFYNTVEECRKAEEELLTKYDVANNPRCYNLKNAAVGWTSEDLKGEKHPLYGRTGEKHPNYGKRGKGTPHYGKHHTEDTKRRMSQALKGENNPMYGKPLSEKQKDALLQATNYKKTPIVAIDKNGKVKIFEGQRECSRVLGIHPGSVSRCLKGRRKSAGGYTFKYIEQLESGIYEGML